MMIFLVFVSTIIVLTTSEYVVEMKRLSDEPVITSQKKRQSVFRFNYNSAMFPLPNGNFGLGVRTQNLKASPKSLYDVGPSYIAYSEMLDQSGMHYHDINYSDVMIWPKDYPKVNQSAGAEDPRIVYYDVTKSYYMFYTAVVYNEEHNYVAKLSLAVCDTTKHSPLDFSTCWELHGPLFPSIPWSKSGALYLNRNSGQPHYLFFGDSYIQVATTTDLINYSLLGQKIIETRSDHFDSQLVESGPPPEILEDGNILFLYNSARDWVDPNPKNYKLQYNLGYVILDGKNPTKIIQRSETPIFSPELDWERCDNKTQGFNREGLTPNVVFFEGWRKIGVNKFQVVYQGCDTFTGIAELKVDIKQ